MSEVTKGSIKVLYDNNKNSPLYKYPIVQIINIKSVETNGKTRYRALISDSVHFMQAMLATQYAPVVEQGKIKKNSIIRLRETVCNELEFRKILIVLELDVVTADIDGMLGTPVALGQNANPSSPIPNSTNERSKSSSSFPSLPQGLTQDASQGGPHNGSHSGSHSGSQVLPPTQSINNNNNNTYSSQIASSQLSWSSENYHSMATPDTYLQQSSFSNQGLSNQYNQRQSPNQFNQGASSSPSPSQYNQGQSYKISPSSQYNQGPPSSQYSIGPPSSQYMSQSQQGSINLMSSASQNGSMGMPFSSQKSSVDLFNSITSLQPTRMSSSPQQLPPKLLPTPMLRISELSPYVKSWSIKARVSMKTPIRTWDNGRTKGRLFNAIFIDQTGEIGATAFNDQVTRFYDLLKDGQVYNITKAKITMNNKRFSVLTTDYELHFEKITEIRLCPDDPNIPYMKMNQVKLSELNTYALYAIVDVLGVVVEDRGMFEVVRKTNGAGKLVYKREIIIVDESLYKVKFTLWDDEAREFDTSDTPIISCKGARVGNYQGPYLTASANTTIKRNPPHPEAKKLKDWYESVGFCMDFKTFQPFGKDDIDDRLPRVTLNKVISEQFGYPDKPDYFVCRATVTFIKPDNAIYAGCPDCKKKLYMNENRWFCERCERVYANPVWKYILTVSLDDPMGQMYANIFDELATLIFGLTAQQFMTLKETDEHAAFNLINKMLFKTYNIKMRARMEHYNGMERIKYQIVEINEINLIKESKRLVNDISNLL